jgi:phage gp37-like protein
LQDSGLVIDDATTSTQANVALKNNHSETNSALVLTPKGTGAFIVGPKPDGTATGGNARGASAIDISTTRTAAAQVASGANAILIGGSSTASTADAISIGRNVISSGTLTTAVGYAAQATGTRSTAFGNSAVCSASLAVALGPEVTVNASEAIGIGWGCTASATRAVCVASDNSANLRAGFFTWPFRAVYWSGQTTTNAATILNLDGTATNRFTIAASTALAVDILLVARRATTQDKWLVARRFLGIRRDGSNNTALIGTVQTLGTDQSGGSPTWTFALTADDTNEALQLEVTGATSETVEWRATAFYRVA